MQLLTAAWIVCVIWLWTSQIEIHYRRHNTAPEWFGLVTLFEGSLTAVALGACAMKISQWTGSAPETLLERREWHHAFWWSSFPIVMLLGTVYLMISAR